MDYFHAPTPGVAGTASDSAGEPDYFGGGTASRDSSSSGQSSQSFFGEDSDRKELSEGDAATAAGFGQPTANPFQLGHPTAFPAQNGASSAFQQAILSRRGHGSGLGPPTVSLIAQQQQQQQQQLPNSNTSIWPMGSPGGRSQKRQHHPSTHSHKSVRTPIISSPRQLGSQSPLSSSSSSSSKDPSPSQTPSEQAAFAKQLQQPLLYKNLPKLSLSAATPAATAHSKYKPSSSSTSLEASFSASASSSANSSPVSTSSQFRGSLGSSVPRGGASSTASGMRRGSAVSNPRFKCVSSPEALAEMLSATSPPSKGGSTALMPIKRSQPVQSTDDSMYSSHTLVLDLRPHTAFVAQGRIAGSINVCVPSTLLRRPNFGLSKISETLCTKRERRLFESALNLDNVAGKQIKRILLLDQESNYLVNEGLLHSFLAKLDRQGFKGELGWLKGGFSGIQKYLDEHEDSRNSLLDHVIEQNALSETEGEDGDTAEEDEEMQDQRMEDASVRSVPQNTGLAISNATSSQAKLRASLLATGPPSNSSASSGSAGSDSLFSAALASSQSSVDDNSVAAFDRKKLALPDMRKRQLRLSASMSDATDPSAAPPAKSSSTPVIRPKNLPMSAFQFGSTAAAGVGNLDDVNKSPNAGLQKFASTSSPISTKGKAEYPAGFKGESRGAVNTRQAANPFFDNIRQNIETQDLDTMLAHIKPMQVPKEYLGPQLVRHFPAFLQDICRLSPQSRAVKVNTEFFDIEQREQKRLQGILDWHCQQSTTAPTRSHEELGRNSNTATSKDQDEKSKNNEDYHPFSISAGVEKGHLNRYKNMWPYEHARVRLQREAEPTSGDYVNASHIRLRGSSRHYIASQGPLESTTEHFWQLVLQEKVTTIVMLTLLAEGGREKCYNYFKTAEYDSVSVKTIEEKGDAAAMQESINDNFGFFGMEAPLPPKTDKRDKSPSEAEAIRSPVSRGRSDRLDAATVRRTLEIRDKRDPNAAPLIVTHIQYIRWPDFDIPPDPDCVVDLIHETNRAKRLSGYPNAPVLVHCSAGVGRTGTFIAVDTLLDRYREEREREKSSHSKTSLASSNVMDVDRQCGSPAPLPEDKTASSSTSKRRGRLGSSESNSDYLQAMTLDNESHGRRPSDKTSASESVASDAEGSTSALVEKLKCRTLLPEDHTEPIKALVDQMREQRMSSVANAGQYAFTYLALMAGIRGDLLGEGVDIKSS